MPFNLILNVPIPIPKKMILGQKKFVFEDHWEPFFHLLKAYNFVCITNLRDDIGSKVLVCWRHRFFPIPIAKRV